MKLSHALTRTSAVFDDPNLVSSAGLVPVMALADAAGLRTLTDERLTVATDKGANAGLKVASLIGGMVAGADSIDDMAVLRHGGMSKVFTAAYAPPGSGRSYARSPSGTCAQASTSRRTLMLVMRMICEDISISRWGYLPMELEVLKCPFWCRV